MRTKSVRLCNGRLRISTWRLQLPSTHGDACFISDHANALDALPISIAHNTPQILSTSCWTCDSIYPSRYAALLSCPSRRTRFSASHSPVAADRQHARRPELRTVRIRMFPTPPLLHTANKLSSQLPFLWMCRKHVSALQLAFDNNMAYFPCSSLAQFRLFLLVHSFPTRR